MERVNLIKYTCWINNYISALNAPFATFLIRSYMIQLPDELFDAAKLDGANTFQIFLE